jgi:calcium-dependent protein kinase
MIFFCSVENIMFSSNDTSDWTIKLIDFGLSTRFEPGLMLTDIVGTIYTIAPEVLFHAYSKKADLWSVGVIAFMLISGMKPFWGSTKAEIVNAIRQSKYDFEAPVWKLVSVHAKSFVEALLTKEPVNRLTARDALKHPWLMPPSARRSLRSKQKSSELTGHNSIVLSPTQHDILESIVGYGDTSEFYKLAMHAIARRSSSHDLVKLRELFEKIDTNHDGHVMFGEFREALEATGLFRPHQISSLFRNVDYDATHRIKYLEFLAATIETQGRLDEQTLAEAFDDLDVDHSGFIHRADLRQLLGVRATDAVLDRLIEQGDADKDGKISFTEFKHHLELERAKALKRIQRHRQESSISHVSSAG